MSNWQESSSPTLDWDSSSRMVFALLPCCEKLFHVQKLRFSPKILNMRGHVVDTSVMHPLMKYKVIYRLISMVMTLTHIFWSIQHLLVSCQFSIPYGSHWPSTWIVVKKAQAVIPCCYIWWSKRRHTFVRAIKVDLHHLLTVINYDIDGAESIVQVFDLESLFYHGHINVPTSEFKLPRHGWSCWNFPQFF